jgi:hypothetical protein
MDAGSTRSPIVRRAGWSGRTKMLLAFMVVDLVAVATLIYVFAL